MKLFVWDSPPWGGTMIVAVAESLEAAKEAVRAGKQWAFGREKPIEPSLAEYVYKKLGKPSRVVDLPCAEWHWYEP